MLDKAKSQALDFDEKTIAYDILELEKIIESQFITRSISGRADQLIEQSEELSLQNFQASKLSNLSLKLYSILLENGYAKMKMKSRKFRIILKKKQKTLI